MKRFSLTHESGGDRVHLEFEGVDTEELPWLEKLMRDSGGVIQQAAAVKAQQRLFQQQPYSPPLVLDAESVSTVAPTGVSQRQAALPLPPVDEYGEADPVKVSWLRGLVRVLISFGLTIGVGLVLGLLILNFMGSQDSAETKPKPSPKPTTGFSLTPISPPIKPPTPPPGK